MSAAWKEFAGDLAAATDRDFERLALGLLRLRWPGLVQPPPRQHLDRKGIDLVQALRGKSAGVVVQCKGFYEHEELTDSSYRQIKESIDKFINSDFGCIDYVLIHNRTGRNRIIAKKIDGDLARVIGAGKARNVTQWDRQTFIREFKNLIREHLKIALDNESKRALARTTSLFRSEIYVPIVPVSEQCLKFSNGGRQKLAEVHRQRLEEPARLIGEAGNERWSLLTGLFGTGKTSAVLRAAHHSKRIVIYARCAELNFREGAVNTTGLLEALLRSLDLFSDFDADTRQRLLRLASKSLANLLVEENDALLILDGLDENRQYSTPKGVQTLSNSLAELRCPIVLTTRREHFDATFANFEYLSLEQSTKGGTRRYARILQLELWDLAQVEAFLAKVIEAVDAAAPSLVRLRDRVRARAVTAGEQELLQHPLFLQMITALAGDGIEAGLTSAEVLERWTQNKLKRDLEVDRVLPTDVHSWADYADELGVTLEQIASVMIDQQAGNVLLTEAIAEGAVVAALRQAFPRRRQDALTATSASLLVPAGPRNGPSEVEFCLRIFQEFYLARHLVRTGADWRRYPAEVQKLCAEVAEMGCNANRRGTGC